MIHILDLKTMTEIDRQTLQERFPVTTFPQEQYLTNAMLADFGCAVFTIDPQPPYSPFSSIVPGTFTQGVNGDWTFGWSTVDASLEQCRSALMDLLHQQKQIALSVPVVFNEFKVPLDTSLVTLLREGSMMTNQVVVKVLDGWLSLSPTDASDLASKIAGKLLAISANENVHDLAIQDLTNISAAREYDVTTGWPQ